MAAAAVREEDGIFSINITPLVDVFLVLLILVMIGSTLQARREIPVAVPRTVSGGEPASAATDLALDGEGRIFLDGNPADSASVLAALRSGVAGDPAHQVLVAADQRLPYAEVVRVLAWVRDAGVRKYALKVARPE